MTEQYRSSAPSWTGPIMHQALVSPPICGSHYSGWTAPETQKVFWGSHTMFLEEKRMFYLSGLDLLVQGNSWSGPCWSTTLLDGGGNQSLLTQRDSPVATRIRTLGFLAARQPRRHQHRLTHSDSLAFSDVSFARLWLDNSRTLTDALGFSFGSSSCNRRISSPYMCEIYSNYHIIHVDWTHLVG